MFIVGPIILWLDVAGISGLLAGIVVTTLALRPSRLARPRVAFWRSAGLIALVAALALVSVANFAAIRSVISSDNQGRPTPAQVIGTWTDSQGAMLRVLPGGTFTAAGLPADANDPAGDGKPHPTSGHGAWQIVREQGAWNVGFTLSGGSQFQFEDLGSSVSAADAGTAWFAWVFPQFGALNLWEFYQGRQHAAELRPRMTVEAEAAELTG